MKCCFGHSRSWAQPFHGHSRPCGQAFSEGRSPCSGGCCNMCSREWCLWVVNEGRDCPVKGNPGACGR
jgi:hypothetical protein